MGNRIIRHRRYGSKNPSSLKKLDFQDPRIEEIDKRLDLLFDQIKRETTDNCTQDCPLIVAGICEGTGSKCILSSRNKEIH